IPYILHGMEAGIIASQLTNTHGVIDEEVVAAAILHDTMEDAFVTYETLVELFNERIAKLVQSQSEDKTKSWQERKEATLELLRQNESEAVEITTLADKLSNMRAIARDYAELKDGLWSKFNAGKEQQQWYYSSLGSAFKFVTHTPAYQEYQSLVQQVFQSE
ncbi:MAG TPA: HD domain-containing protein, partial [Savagea sp.]